MKLEQGISTPADSGSRSSAVDRDGAATFLSGRGQAWQRAMEQAEFAGWFKGPEDGRKSTGSAAASEVPPALHMTAGQSTPMPHYSLFDSAQPSRFLADSRDALLGAGSSCMSGDAGLAGYATGDERAQGLGNSSGTVSALAALLRGAVASAVGPTVEFDVTMASLTGVMSASRWWPTAAAPSAANSASELVCAEDGRTEAEVSPVSTAQGGTANADPNPKIRVHVEWSEAGVRVWLGVDHDAEAALPQMQRQLDRVLAESGSQLLSLVCNGRPVVGPMDRPWAKSFPLAMSLPGPYQPGFQGGDWSSGQPIFHLDEQVER
ncbi:hypothetical protein RSP673_010630 [Ralstonia solanacearum P673]|uniref:hypothetical protein n=1 Tax=Ralstonia solanacearum TaxID=305 RepID=UPI0004B3356A|nr:hypothetical protein [Ralstonia solanacearum]MCL9848118.1 hypothetical protein [Ralstonia solanacearum]MCL9854604.1 hypothetical protein [Ralstonia solanacearum]MCL9859852.1 hypothetical protein [Ralstonia solanacearum]MCL9864349.1 hypothetical protein [Ralstonia solanacearum]MCL9868747.1 hypothetical protein [Ralstonia solanacearum]